MFERRAAFTHVPDWYTWERQCVREELESGAYQLDIPVQICMMVNMREICRVGEGRLHHDENGFHLTGCSGKLDYFQKPEPRTACTPTISGTRSAICCASATTKRCITAFRKAAGMWSPRRGWPPKSSIN